MTHDNTSTNVPSECPTDRWVFSVVEPLLSTAECAELDRAMVDAVFHAPKWMCAWFGGVIASIMQTLPARDPWRHLSATIERFPGRPLQRGETPPLRTGATVDGTAPFGTYRDADDLSSPAFDDPTIDIATVALVEPMHGMSPALMAFGADGWQQSIAAHGVAWESFALTKRQLVMLTSAERESAYRFAAECYFDSAAQALRWALHRRRSYGLSEDPWPVMAAWMWSLFAYPIARGEPWATDVAEDAIGAASIDRTTDDDRFGEELGFDF